MEYDCLTRNGKLIVAKPRGWKWSKRERAEFDIAVHRQSVVSLRDEPVTLSNGVRTTMGEIDRSLVAENLTLREIDTATKLLEQHGYSVAKAVGAKVVI